MPDAIAITVERISKAYRIWKTPAARLEAPLCAWAASLLPDRLALTHSLNSRARACSHDFHALRDISFQVRQSECVGILGYNGSGKSTLLQIIAGTLQPSSGSIAVHGRVAALLELGSGFNPEFTGRENALLYGSILGLSRAEMQRRLPEIEEFAEIGAFIDEPVRSYSSGMTVRLAFAVLTQLDPDILIIDEALAVGDAYFQHKSMQRTRKLRELGKCVLLVTHDASTIKSMCDRAIILERGVLIREGPAEAVADYYSAMVAKKTKDAEIRQYASHSGRIITRSGNRHAEITRCELFHGDGTPRRAFTTGEPARVACTVAFHKHLESPTIGFLIRDRLGSPVFGTNTFHLKLPSRRYIPGDEPEYVFDFPVSLGPGTYSMTMAVHAQDNHLIENFDWFDNVLVFEVLPGPGPLSAGCAYLPVSASISSIPRLTRRNYSWGTPLDFSADGCGCRHLAAGWGGPESHFTWSVGHEARVSLETSGAPEVRTLRANVHPFLYPGCSRQRVQLSLNNHALGEWLVVEDGDHALSVPIGAQPKDGRWEIVLSIPDARSPRSVGASADDRLLGIALRRLEIL